MVNGTSHSSSSSSTYSAPRRYWYRDIVGEGERLGGYAIDTVADRPEELRRNSAPIIYRKDTYNIECGRKTPEPEVIIDRFAPTGLSRGYIRDEETGKFTGDPYWPLKRVERQHVTYKELPADSREVKAHWARINDEVDARIRSSRARTALANAYAASGG